MIARLVRVMTTHPELLLDYASGYVDLLQIEALTYKRHMEQKLYFAVAFAALSVISVLLCAIGLMMWAVVSNQIWLLIAVPALFILITLIAYQKLVGGAPSPAFAQVRAQMAADAAMAKHLLHAP